MSEEIIQPIIAKEEKPENTKLVGRNPDGTWKKGFCPNPGGRKRNPLKEFSLAEFNSWTDEQKKAFLDKISPIDRWKMTEGMPKQDVGVEGTEDGLPIIIKVIKDGENNQTTPETVGGV